MSHSYSKNLVVVVADGTRARFFANAKNDGGLKLTETRELTPQNLANDGPSGSRPPESSDQETDEATFAKQLAAHLLRLAQHQELQEVIIAADPQTLGQLRPCLHQRVTNVIVKEFDKVLTNSSVAEIEKSLS